MTSLTARRALPNPSLPRATIAHPLRVQAGAHGLKAVGSFLPRLTAKAFQKYGFSTAGLITDWAAIVGRELAQYTAPERLKWPRIAERPDEEGAAAADRKWQGATLVLKVDGARALEVQYGAAQLIERINRYFGYRAVGDLRIVQAPVEGDAPRSPRKRLPAPENLRIEVAGVADAGLRSALARLGAGMRAARAASR